MTDFNQKTHDTDVGSHGGQSRQMMEVFENQEFGSIRVVARGGQDLLLCKRCGESVGVCESLRRSETPLQRPPNETRGGRSEGESVWRCWRAGR